MSEINCADPGDTAWVMTASVLVLGMMPGLALFEAGLLRARNSVSIVLQVISGIMLLSLLWFIVGFSLTFGESVGGVIGNPKTYGLYWNLSFDECDPKAPTIPIIVYGVFQMMFAAITPLLQTGAFAERLRWSAFVVYIILWELIVYYPLTHWIWGGGWLSPDGINNLFHGGQGVYDFAGGIVIHTSSGMSALVSVLLLGKRKGYEKNNFGSFPTSNLLLTTVGASLLWLGWFGFNAGSAGSANRVAALAVVNTQLAVCTSGLVWLLASWFHGKPSLVETLNGGIAESVWSLIAVYGTFVGHVSIVVLLLTSLAGITPASGYISPFSAFILAIVLGISSFLCLPVLKRRWRVDDALDVSVVHGFTGLVGSLAIGFVGELKYNPDDGVNGWLGGNPVQILLQLVGVVVSMAWSGVWTFILLKSLDKILPMGIRVSADEEEQGLDHCLHGEYAGNAEREMYIRGNYGYDYSSLLHPDDDDDDDDEETGSSSKIKNVGDNVIVTPTKRNRNDGGHLSSVLPSTPSTDVTSSLKHRRREGGMGIQSTE